MMRTIAATVYQPAVPFRAVLVYRGENGAATHYDVPVVGVQVIVLASDEAEFGECHHEAVLFEDGRFRTAGEVEAERGGLVIVGPASSDAAFWAFEIAQAERKLGLSSGAGPAPAPTTVPMAPAVAPAGPLTFAALCELEPRLRELEREVLAYAAGPRDRNLDQAYLHFKRRAGTLVGFGRVGSEPEAHPLRTDTAYKAVIARIADVLEF